MGWQESGLRRAAPACRLRRQLPRATEASPFLSFAPRCGPSGFHARRASPAFVRCLLGGRCDCDRNDKTPRPTTCTSPRPGGNGAISTSIGDDATEQRVCWQRGRESRLDGPVGLRPTLTLASSIVSRAHNPPRPGKRRTSDRPLISIRLAGIRRKLQLAARSARRCRPSPLGEDRRPSIGMEHVVPVPLSRQNPVSRTGSRPHHWLAYQPGGR